MTGLVRIRALRGFGAGRHAEDVYLQFIEYWVPVVQQGPKHDQGNTLIAYAYHCQCGNGSGGSLRYDYDPAGHPDMPSHVHRPGRRRKSVTYVTPEVAIEQFERFVFARLEGGFQPRFSS